MDLQIKICSKKISHNTKSLYLYIRLKGCVFYEKLNIVIRKEEEGTEDYYIKLKKAEDYRLCRFYELSNNPSDIYEKKLSQTQPPEYVYIGKIEHNGASCKCIPKEIMKHIEANLYLKAIPFSDFVKFANNLEEEFRSNPKYVNENLSILLRINPPIYWGVQAFISFSLIRNERSKALECFAFPCNEIIKPKETEIELDETIKVKVVATQTQKSKRSYKTYIMKDNSLGYVKIGKSVNVLVRERTLEAQNPKISLFAVCQKDVETELHRKYKAYRVRGEWFKLTKKEIDKIVNDYDFILKEY